MFDNVCVICGKDFRTQFEDQKRCPTCIDARNVEYGDGRTVALGRSRTSYLCLLIGRTPTTWQFHAQQRGETRGHFKQVFKGKDLEPGYDPQKQRWDGRIDLFADRAYIPNDLVAVDVCTAIHAVQDATETHEYLRIRRLTQMERLRLDIEDLPLLGLMWIVREGPPIEDAGAMWSKSVVLYDRNSGAAQLSGTMVITATPAGELMPLKLGIPELNV